MGASSLPIAALGAWRMFGMPDVSTASSFRRHVVVAKHRVVVEEHRPARTALDASRNGLATARGDAMITKGHAMPNRQRLCSQKGALIVTRTAQVQVQYMP